MNEKKYRLMIIADKFLKMFNPWKIYLLTSSVLFVVSLVMDVLYLSWLSFLSHKPRGIFKTRDNTNIFDTQILKSMKVFQDDGKHGNNKGKQILSQKEDEDLVIYGYRKNTCKSVVTNICYIFTLGLLRLVFHWFPNWRLISTHSKCDLEIAEKVLVVEKYQEKFKFYYVEEVKLLSGSNIWNENDTNENEHKSSLLSVYLGDGYLKEMRELKAIWCKKLCYVWDDQRKEFVKLVGLDRGRKCFEYHRFKGYSAYEQSLRSIIYGKNQIDVPVNTILTLLILEALTPFYIFQVFSLIVWFAEFYYYYTIAIIVMSLFGITSSIIQTRRNQRSLHETVHSAETVIVYRGNGRYEEIPSCHLVPGDVIEIPKNGCTMQCDAVLLNGSCIVNEGMLTGESVPITKNPIPKTNALYDVKEDSFHTLFCGTHVIQTRSQGGDRILAVVLRTGFLTSKGELVRSILYPPPSDFKFDRDSYKFIVILTVIALLGCAYTVIVKSEKSIAATDILIKALDLITIVVPPALPAAMTVGKLYALNRLKRQQIFCMNSRVINVSGSIDCVCFDKTGTLTEDGLDMWGVIPVDNNKLKEPIRDVATLPKSSTLLKGMATCHSLTIINDELLGDPLDVKVFEATGWTLEEAFLSKYCNSSVSNIAKPPIIPRRVSTITINDLNGSKAKDAQFQVEIIRQYQFSSTLQRMSVVTKTDDSNYLEIFCKGSPEMIASLSNPESVPNNMQDKLKEFTEKGYRVIALGTKIIEEISNEEVQKMERTEVESNLEFTGLIILENRIKRETSNVIKVLKEAQIKTVMITGDNIQTALSVAKECGIIDKNENVIDVVVEPLKYGKPTISFKVTELNRGVNEEMQVQTYSCDEIMMEDGNNFNFKYCYAMTGTTWALVREHYPEKIVELAENGVVFARMSGQQKQQIIQELQKLGYYTAMCGDGANDCGALKAAHVGISLSEEDSSVASPFTSKTPDVSCVPKVIKEGRAALTTSIGVFKFMVCYSLAQFTSCVILYGIDSNLTSLQFLYIDICLVLHFMSFFGKTEAYTGPLDKNRPPTSLLSFTSITSIIFQMFFVIVFQVISYKVIQTYDWFTPFIFDTNNTIYYTCYENYAVFCMSIFQYKAMAVAFSKGKPYRKPVYTNKIFLASLTVMVIISTYITLYPAQWIVSALELLIPPNLNAGLAILGLGVVNLACSLLAEDIVVQYFLDKKLAPKIRNLFRSRKSYLDETQHLKLHSRFSENFNDSKNDVVFINNEINKSDILKIQDGVVNAAYENSEISPQTTKL